MKVEKPRKFIPVPLLFRFSILTQFQGFVAEQVTTPRLIFLGPPAILQNRVACTNLSHKNFLELDKINGAF